MKLSSAERQLRQLPTQPGSPLPQLKLGARGTEKRRSLSLRGRESMAQVSREMEEKLSELETRVTAMQRRSASSETLVTRRTPQVGAG